MKTIKSLMQAGTVALALMAGTAHAADLLDDAKQRGTLRIAVEGTYPPFNFRDGQGKLTGFDVEIAEGIAAKLGLKPLEAEEPMRAAAE